MKRKPLLIMLSWTPKATTMNASTWFLCATFYVYLQFLQNLSNFLQKGFGRFVQNF